MLNGIHVIQAEVTLHFGMRRRTIDEFLNRVAILHCDNERLIL